MTLLFLAMSSLVHADQIMVAAEGHAMNPVWSSDGTKLAFEINSQAGDISLFVADVQSGKSTSSPQQIQLTVQSSSFGGPSNMVTAAPVWHPQQNILFFEGAFKGSSNRLHVYSFAGPTRQVISEGDLPGDLSWPSLSVDGKQLMFVSDATGYGDVYTLSLQDWKTVTQITDSDFAEMAPRFNSNSDIIYTRKQDAGEDVYLYKNGAPSDWVGGAGDQTRPIWSGTSVVFFSSERGGDQWDVVVSTGPKQKKTLAKNVRLPMRSTPALSPDGQWVAYGVEATDTSNQIWVSKLDGSKTVGIKTPHLACGEPSLTKVGDKIYLAYTALPTKGSNWRQLHTMDVTSYLK